MKIIVAVSENGVIGYKGKMPWHLPKDLQYFKKITLHHTVIMGRNTFESIGKPLPNRKNIVLTRSLTVITGVWIAKNWMEVLEMVEDKSEVFIIGGQQIFEQALELGLIQTIYRTLIHHSFDGDTFFREIDNNYWELISEEFSPKDEKNIYDMTFQIWNKK